MLYILISYHLATVIAESLVLPPPMPADWPSVDQTLKISGSYLSDPLVADALAYVNSVVSPALLNIKVSTYKAMSSVEYNDNTAANCYWPFEMCTRSTDTKDYNADVFVCPNANDWGLTYDDGPTIAGGVDTPGIRAQLELNNVKATFFVCGTNVAQQPLEVLSTYNSGHQIASHTWSRNIRTNIRPPIDKPDK